MEYDNSPPCSSRFFKNGVDATATAAVGSANSSASVAGLSREADDVDDAMTFVAVAVGSAISSSSALSREKEAAAGVAKMATIVARRMNRLMVVFIVSCLLDYVMVMMRDRQSTTNDFFEFLCCHQARIGVQ